MRKEDHDFLAAREETMQWNGREITVREMGTAADLLLFREQGDFKLKFAIRCCFEKDGKPVYDDADLPFLKAAPYTKMKPLLDVVDRVMGFNVEDEGKKSSASPSDA